MNINLESQLPVYRRIENDLKRYIAEHQLRRHDMLPSETVLAAQHGASVGTVRKALNNLVAEKVIYRRHGQGTFVAPRTRKLKLPIVPNREGIGAETSDDYFRFFLGALAEANAADLPCEPMIVEREDFLANLEDAGMIYPEIGGVIFFRGYSNWERAAGALRRQRLPMLFFGPNMYGGREPDCCRVFHDEAEVARMVAGHLESRGLRRIAVCVNDREIGMFRLERFRAEAAGRLEVTVFPGEMAREPELARGLPGKFDAVYCTVDVQGVQLIQTLERDLGFRVPEDIAVIGVDNIPAGAALRPGLTTVDLCNYENGRLCIRRFAEYISRGEREPFVLDGKLQLVTRESC